VTANHVGLHVAVAGVDAPLVNPVVRLSLRVMGRSAAAAVTVVTNATRSLPSAPALLSHPTLEMKKRLVTSTAPPTW